MITVYQSTYGSYMVIRVGRGVYLQYLPQAKPHKRNTITLNLLTNKHNVNEIK